MIKQELNKNGWKEKKEIVRISKVVLFMFIFLLTFSFLSATEQTYRSYVAQNTNFTIRETCSFDGAICDGTFSCNLSVLKPDNSYLITNGLMYKLGNYHNYNLTDTQTIIGDYEVTVYCSNSTQAGQSTFYYQVNGNGKAPPEGSIKVLFIIIFLVIVGSLLYSFIYSIGHLAKLDFDLLDMAKDWSIYFCLLAFYMLSKFYLGNPDIESFTLILITVGAFTHILVPMVAFILNLTVGSWQRQNLQALNIQQKSNWGRRR